MGSTLTYEATKTQSSLNRNNRTTILIWQNVWLTKFLMGITAANKLIPGMAGSLLYHMAMVTKMESETRMLLEELHVDLPDCSR